MNRILALTISLLLSLSSFAITVKIENTSLDLDAKDNAGNSVISANAKLTVSGIKGKKFDLVAIVEDDQGNWHKDHNGNTVKTYYTCNATYENSVWEHISVWIKHSKLAPKPGKHTYKVFLYVYYNGEWYEGTYVGSYTQTGNSNSNSHSHSHSHSSNSSTTKTCTTCNGLGHRTCGGCAGKGGVQFPQYSYYPFYSVNYVWIPCTVCGGAGQLKCYTCNGTGSITTYYNNNSSNNSNSSNNYSGGNSYNYNYNNNNSYNYNNNSSSSSSSSYTTCSSCGGSGVCSSCHGSGGSWQDTGYYTGSGTKSWINCPSCNGSKKCFMCYGRGKY